MSIKTGSSAPSQSNWEQDIWSIRGIISSNINYDSSSFGGTKIKTISFKDAAGTTGQEAYIVLRTNNYYGNTTISCCYHIKSGSTGSNNPAANTTGTFSGMNLKIAFHKIIY